MNHEKTPEANGEPYQPPSVLTHQHDSGAKPRTSFSGGPGEDTPETIRKTRNKVVAASFIGNFVEWFDYAVYGYLAVTITTVFFPESDKQTGLLLTFGLFAVSFFVRPLGGFIWGHLGDKFGRRLALSWSILIMSAATFCIALIPGYDTIGLWAPIILLIIRVIQGFSASGEYAGAAAFLVEYAPPKRRGLFAAVVPASTATGLLLGSLLAALLTGLLSTDQMHDWGWRLPFLLAAPMGLIGRYIRTRLEDSPAFRALEAEDKTDATPIKDLFRDHWRQLIQAVGAVLLNAVGFYILLSYMPTYLSQVVGLDEAKSYLATTVALLTYIGFIFVMGMLSDKLGRKKVLMTASILFVVFTVPLFMLLDTGNFVVIVLVQILLGAMLTLNDGTLPSYLAEMFPTRVRYTGFAVSFNLSNALFGGTAPFVATFLIGFTGTDLAPGWYLMGAAVIALIAVAFSAETSKQPLK